MNHTETQSRFSRAFPLPSGFPATARPRLVCSARIVDYAPVAQRAPAPTLPTAIAPVVHEMRNFLAPMPLALEILQRHAGLDEHGARALALLRRQADGLSRLVSDLLDVSRVAGGKLQLKRESCSLQDVAQWAVDICAPAAQARSQRLVLQACAARAGIDADALRLAQAVANLVFNAVRHASEGGEIRVSVDVEQGQAVLRVRDDGCGMSAALREQVFELGMQASSGEGGGLGIGLYVVRCVVEAHGGTVSAWSEGPGQGSTFTVRLPLAPDAACAGGGA